MDEPRTPDPDSCRLAGDGPGQLLLFSRARVRKLQPARSGTVRARNGTVRGRTSRHVSTWPYPGLLWQDGEGRPGCTRPPADLQMMLTSLRVQQWPAAAFTAGGDRCGIE